jgi:hypothetical protein
VHPLSIVGLFCEDIREETGNVFTLIGLMPDNIIVEGPPVPGERRSISTSRGFLSKLCVFVRANFDPDDAIGEIKLSVVLPDEQELSIGGATIEVIERAKREAKDNGSPLAGLIMRAVLGAFKLPKAGLVRLEATIGPERRLLAALNFKIPDGATSSSAQPQPS